MRRVIKYFFLTVAIVFFVTSQELCAQKKNRSTSSSVAITESVLKDSSLRATDYYLRAVAALNTKADTAKTLAYCKEALDNDSLHAPSLFLIGTLLGDVGQATLYHEKAAQIDPDNVWYKLQLSILYGASGKYRESLDMLSKVHNGGNRNSQTYRYLAALYDVLDDSQAANRMIDSALMLYGDDPELLLFKGDILKKNNNSYAYLDNTKRLIECVPNNVGLSIKLAEAYMTVKQDSMAEVTLKNAYDIDSTDVDLIVAMTEFYEWRNDHIKFFDYLGKIFETDDKEIPLKNKILYFDKVVKNPFYYRNYITYIQKLLVTLRVKYDYNYDVENFYAQHLINIGDTDEAREVYKKFLYKYDIEEKSLKEAYNTVISISNYLNDTVSVLKYAGEAELRFKDDFEEPMFLAYILKEYDFNRAVKLLKKKIAKLPTDSLKSVYYCNMGDIYQEKENITESFKCYEKSLEKNPDNIMTLNNYAYFMSLRNESLDKALVMIDKVLEKEPSIPVYIDTKAWILYLMGDYAEAKILQRKAIALDTSKSSDLMLHYADILAALGENVTAEISYRKALERGADEKQIEERIENLNKK